MKDYKLIGFDMDGTLCHPATKFETVFKQAFGVEKSDVNDIWMDTIMAEGARTGIEAITALFPNFSQAKADDYLHHFSQLWAQEQRLFDGVIPMLDQLRDAGHKLTLITNGPSTMQHAVIDHLGIRDCFDHVFTTGDEAIGINKPNRGCFDKVAQIFNVTGNECLFIGDGQVNDYQGALGAGWHAMWVKPNHPSNTARFKDMLVSNKQTMAYDICWV